MAATTMGVKLDNETRARLKKLGEAKSRSTHWLMKEAIHRYLDAEEILEQQRLEDHRRYQAYLDTGTHIPHENMTTWLDELASLAARKTTSE